MLKFVLIIAAVGLASARVLDTWWLTNERFDEDRQLDQYEGYYTKDSDQLKRLSFDELLKQMFVVKVLDHVRYPLMERNICPVSDTIVTNQNKYRKGIDGDMIYVMELCRTFGHLKKDDYFNIAKKDHVRQMIGLQRILARSTDWETFTRNACFARKEINEVVFVNALLEAIRQREDTRRLVMPAIHEILPEKYLDRDIVRSIRNVELNQLGGTNGRYTTRGNFFDLIGLGGIKNLFGYRTDDTFGSDIRLPGREIRVELTKRNNDVGTSNFEDKIVIPVDRQFDITRDLALLTNDVGLKDFVQFTINDLCLRENDLDKKRMDHDNVYTNTILNRFDSTDGMDRRFDTRNDYRYRLQDIVRGNRGDYDDRTRSWDRNNGRDYNTMSLRNWGSRFGQDKDYENDRYLNMLRGSQIYEGRLIKDNRNRDAFGGRGYNDDDTTNWNRKTDNYFYNKFGDNSIRDRMFDDVTGNSKFDDDYTTGRYDDRFGNKNDRGLYGQSWNDIRFGDYLNDERYNYNDLNTEGRNDVHKFRKTVPRSDVLLHNLKQLVARVENEKISLGLKNTRDILSNNCMDDEMLGKNRMFDDTQTDLRGTDDIREVKNIVRDIVNNNRDNMEMNRVDPMTFDQLIAQTLLKNDNRLNILDVLRDVVENGHQDQRSSRNIGFNLNDRVVQKVLKTLTDEVECQRTKFLGSYNRRDLYVDGVTINNVDVDQLKTLTEFCDVDVRNLLDKRNIDTRIEQKMVVAKVERLNHKDFTIKLDLDSDRNRKVMIRTFLGPKLTDRNGQELVFDEIRQKFMLIDSQTVNLQSGKNVIRRRSKDIKWTARDTTPLTEIYKRVMISLDTQMNTDNFIGTKKVIGQDCRFPHRLIIPRGRTDGIQMQLFVIVTDLGNGIIERDDLACAMGVGTKISDGRSLGFPLDRRVDNVQDMISLPNVQIKDVVIGHDERTKKDCGRTSSLDW